MGRPGNYRLVSLTLGSGKVWEHILLISTPSLLEDKKQELSTQLCLGQITLAWLPSVEIKAVDITCL